MKVEIGGNSFGQMLRRWRETRRVSQLDLALEAEVSSRHISFIETGRAQPSREMVLRLSGVLDVPLRERNALLYAAGFAPLYRETDLNDPQMEQARQALTLILDRMNPFGAIAFDRRWDVVMVNAAFLRMIAPITGPEFQAPPPLTVIPPPRLNALRMLFDPAGWRPFIQNWETVARAALERAHREYLQEQDPAMRETLDLALSSPGVPERWRQPDLAVAQDILIPVEMKFGDHTLRLFTTITSLGSAQDITLQELRIETFHPMDDATRALIMALAQPPTG
ncbi:MAG: helix-turn-helix transcriptional regulator [Blastocatellia bacterium]|nr:helix-turn-helix transcriptional regulator [Blastocatellia bacterium]